MIFSVGLNVVYRSALCALIRVTRGRGPKSPQVFSNGWLALKGHLTREVDWAPLSRLAGFASLRGINPSVVDDSAVDIFVAELEQSGEVENARAHDRRLRRKWNALRAAHPDLGLTTLSIAPQKRKRQSLERSACSPGLLEDMDRYLEWLVSDHAFEDGPDKPLRPSTCKTVAHQLFKAITGLAQSGRRIETITSLADLVTPETFNALMRRLNADRPTESTVALHRLGLRLASVARDWVKAEPDVVQKLYERVRRIAPKTKELGRRTRERLRPFEDENLIKQLLSLPDALLDDAKRAQQAAKRALFAQTAIACELLIYAPLRIANLVSLRIGENVTRCGAGWRIDLPASHVKNGKELHFPIPAEAVASIKAAMRLYEQTDGYLFPGKNTGPKVSGTLSAQIKKAVENRLGVPFHAHLYRSIAMYLQVKMHGPAGFENGMALMGNRDAATIRRNYAYLLDRELIRQGQAAISKAKLELSRRRR